MSNKTLAILGLVFAFLIPPVGIILGAIALKNASAEDKGFAKAALICGIVFTVIEVISVVAAIAIGAAAVKTTVDTATQLANNAPTFTF